MKTTRPLPGLPNYVFIDRIAALPFVDAIVLYGSRARGDARARSDIDLAVSAGDADARQWQQIIDILDDADTLLGIDCLRLDTLSPDDPLRRNIETDGVVLYAKGATA